MSAVSKAPSPGPGASTTSSGKSPQPRCPSQPRSSIGLTSRFCRGIGASGQVGTLESKVEGSAGDPAQLVVGEPLIPGFRHSSQTSGSFPIGCLRFRARTPCGNALACGTRGPSTEPVPPNVSNS